LIALTDVSQYPRLEAYVKGVIGAFKNDQRILMWDLWNEPDNTNGNSYGEENLKQEPKNKAAIVTSLMPDVFRWARAAGPTQPLTSGVWILWAGHDWSNPAKWSAMEKNSVRKLRRYYVS